MKIFNKFIWSKKEPSNKNDIWFDGSTWKMYTEEAWQSFTLPVDTADKVAKILENALEAYQEKLIAGEGIIIEDNEINLTLKTVNGKSIIGEGNIVIEGGEGSDEDTPFEKGDAENSAVLKGEYEGYSNKAISQTSMAVGAGTTAGLKGWYFKAVQMGNDGNVVYLYLTTEQQIPILVSSASAVENQEKNINFNISKGDICSIINGNRLIDCFEVRLNEMSKYGRISFIYKGEGTNPLYTIQNVEELKLEDYSVFCISKPSYGIVELSKCNIALGNNTKSLAESSVSIGLRSTAVGITTYAEGQDTIAVGECSHAEGAFTKSNGIASHTEGFGTQTEELSAHAEGYNTLASGGASHSEGSATKATGLHSHAEGDTTEASGEQSHAEGKQTIAEGEHSHSEGCFTKAFGDNSHAEGENTIAEGKRSHAEGNTTKAIGGNTHTEGLGTIAYNSNEHASGKYNKSTHSSDISKATQFSIGIGTSDTDRKNAFEVRQNGDIYIKGFEKPIQTELTELSAEVSKRNVGAVDTDESVDEPSIPSGGGTPSGDPMHYMFEAVGAEWNGTGADIEKQGVYGDTITHKAGYWNLNELGDITNEEMRQIYAESQPMARRINLENAFSGSTIRTNIPIWDANRSTAYGSIALTNTELRAGFCDSQLEVCAFIIGPMNKNIQKHIPFSASSLSLAFRNASKLSKIIGCLNCSTATDYKTFEGTTSLKEVRLIRLKNSFSFSNSPLLSKDSVLFAIQNSEATSAITITLHADAYARLAEDADIVAALAEKTNVSLASA